VLAIAGNYLLMMFYTTITGWMFAYLFKFIKGDFSNISGDVASAVDGQFGALVSDAGLVVGFMLIAVTVGFLICSLGLKNGVEKITKIMMLALLAIIVVLAVHAVSLPGAGEGIRYYLVPNLDGIREHGLGEVVFAALGQAFFTLSIGIGSMAIFGSYIKKDRRLFGESITIALLDTFVAFTAGLIVIPSCFAYGISPGEGAGLVFKTLPVIFSQMTGGRIWGSMFFLFMLFAALSTVIAVFENIISMGMDKWGWSRKKACLINVLLVAVLSLPCALGFNVLSWFQPLGEGSVVLDLEDFIVSNNLLPIGSMIYVIFCCNKKYGWGWDNFIKEANTGRGLRFPEWTRIYVKYFIPVIIFYIWIQGYISKFFM